MKNFLTGITKFITKLGVHCIFIITFLIVKINDPIYYSVTHLMNRKKAVKSKKKNQIQKTPKRMGTGYFLANFVFPCVSLIALYFAAESTFSNEYGISVNVGENNLGVVSDYSDYGNARKIFAEKAAEYASSDNTYYEKSSVSLKRIYSSANVIDSSALSKKMESELMEMHPESVETEEETVTEEPEFEELISDPDDPDVIPAVVVRAGGQVIGFVTSYDEIEAALEEMKSVCYDLSGVVPENVFFDKEITFESYNINKNAVTTQDKIIEILKGNVSESEYYTISDGEYPIMIAEKLNMSYEELIKCKAEYNGESVSLESDTIKTGTVIELSHEEPFLTVMYSLDTSYDKVIDYSTIKLNDDTLQIGLTELENEGETGLETITSEITYEVKNSGGKVTSSPVKRKIVAREVKKSPVSEVIRIGTMIPDASWGTNPGSGVYFWPVEGGYISSPFGGERNHKGLDIAAPLGTPIYAAAAGTVIDVGSGTNGGYGNCVIIQNDDGNITYYAHQSETACEVGDTVLPGQVIGYVGSTGDSTGNHLHFEVRSSEGELLDPEEFVSQE